MLCNPMGLLFWVTYLVLVCLVWGAFCEPRAHQVAEARGLLLLAPGGALPDQGHGLHGRTQGQSVPGQYR